MNDLISVVVPIYNVENYLQNCVTSIIKQTYKNLEIILVNDGSTDHSLEIAKQLGEIDNRIKVINKTNGGLSDARNAGIDISKGKYITFIDSDDYIPCDAIEYLYLSMIHNCASISIGRLKTTSKLDDCDITYENFYKIFDKYNAINEMLYANKYSVAAPGKLYLKSLFDNIRFPFGKLHEDVFTTYKVFLKADKVFYGDKLVYYYYHRPGSIMVSDFSKKRLDIIEALEQIEKDIPLEKYGCINGFASQNVEDMYMLLGLSPSRKIIEEFSIWNRVKKYRKFVIFDKNCSNRVRGYALMSYLGMNLSMIIYKNYQNIKWHL